jgi:CBS domain-containing protein
MTAVFGTPLAAVLLAVELLLFELRPRSLLPVAMACSVAGFLRPLAIDSGPLFALVTPPAGLWILGACVLAGLASGMLSAAMTTALYFVEDAFGKLRLHWMWWPALGGLVVGLGGWLQPRVLGVGYDVIADLLHNRLALETVLMLVLIKAIVWTVALGSGTSGGVLAPLLMIGAALGCAIAPLFPGTEPQLWALVCMAAMLGGTMRAPLTAVVFAFGLTQDANALLPSLLGCAVAYGFTVWAMPRSILTEKIARRGHHVFREYGVDPLERHFVEEIMTRNVIAVPAAMSVREAVEKFFGPAQSHRAYPVVADGIFVGMLDRHMFEKLAGAFDDTAIGTLFDGQSQQFTASSETCRRVAARMAALGVERMAVLESGQTRRLVGIVSRSDILKPSRQLFEEEHVRERFLTRRKSS